MDTKDLVKALERFPKGQARGHNLMRGEVTLSDFLAYWFTTNVKDQHQYTGILHYLPQYLEEALDHLRIGTDIETVQLRQLFLDELSWNSLPRINTPAYNSSPRIALLLMVADLIEKVTGYQIVAESVKSYLTGQDLVLDQKFNEFLRVVYRGGLYHLVQECSTSGMSGTFGQTDLRSSVLAGRVMVTFARHSRRAIDQEYSVTFVGEDGEVRGMRFGLQSCEAPFLIALQLITDVIQNWPTDLGEQRRIFQSNANVGLRF